MFQVYINRCLISILLALVVLVVSCDTQTPKQRAKQNPMFYKSEIGLIEKGIYIRKNDKNNSIYRLNPPEMIYKGQDHSSEIHEIISISSKGDNLQIRRLDSIPKTNEHLIIEFTKDFVYVLDYKKNKFGYYPRPI